TTSQLDGPSKRTSSSARLQFPRTRPASSATSSTRSISGGWPSITITATEQYEQSLHECADGLALEPQQSRKPRYRVGFPVRPNDAGARRRNPGDVSTDHAESPDRIRFGYGARGMCWPRS